MSEPSRPGARNRLRTSAFGQPLLERDGDLGALYAARDALREGRGALMLLTGESGIGKTALLDSWFSQLPDSPSVLRTACYVDELDEPFAVWLRLSHADARLSEVLPQPLGTAQQPAQSASDMLRLSVIGIERLVSDSPLILALDDLQWADARSIELVRALARLTSRLPLLLVVGVSLPLGRDLPLHGFLQELARLPAAQLIELQAFTSEAVDVLVSQTDVVGAPRERRELVERVMSLCNGNPLFTVELLRSSAAELGAVREQSNVPIALPLSLAGLIEQRLSGLSVATTEALSAAALVGQPVSVEVLSSALERDVDSLGSDVDAALDCGLLVEQFDGRVRFRHQLVREALVARQSRRRRRSLHAALLPILRRQGGTSAGELARHAEAAGDLPLAVELHEQSARQASRLFAMPEVVRALDRALELGETAELPEERLDQLLLSLADALLRLDRARATRLIERVEGRALVRGDQRYVALARQRQATVLYEAGRRSEAAALLDAVMPELEAFQEHVALADALATRCYCAGSESDFVLIEQLSQQLLELADQIVSPLHRAIALNLMATAAVARGAPHGAPQMGRESVAILSELGRLDLATPLATVTFIRVDLFANLEHPEMVADLVRMGEELDRTGDLRIGADPSESFCTPEFCLWSFLTGDWERGLNDLPDPEALANAPQPQVLKDIAHTVAAEFDLALGDVERGARRLHYIAPHPEAPLGEHSYQQWLMAADRLATLDLERGDIEDARSWMSALDRALELKPHVPGELMLQSLLAELDLLSGNAQSAATRFEEVVERAKQTTNVLARLRGLRGLALSHYRLNRPESALRYAQQAVDMAEQSRLVYEAALSRLTLAEIGLALPTANGRYREVAIEAAATLRRLGATRALERAEAFLEPRRRRDGPLTTRELEIVALVAAGHTDNEIAERLYISRRTVNTHLTNIYAKTGIGNRVELVTWAIANGYVTPRG